MSLTPTESHNKSFFSKKGQLEFYENTYLDLQQAERELFPKYIHEDHYVLDVGCGRG